MGALEVHWTPLVNVVAPTLKPATHYRIAGHFSKAKKWKLMSSTHGLLASGDTTLFSCFVPIEALHSTRLIHGKAALVCF